MKFVIKASRWKYFLLLLVSVGFVAAGVILVLFSSDKWVGWMNIVFFGACAAVFIWQILDRRPRLTIDENGVNDTTLGLGTIPWEDIEEAYVQSISGNDFICLRLRNADTYFERLSPVKKSMVKANEALGFTPFSLNLSGISASTEEVFELVMKMCDKARDCALGLRPRCNLISPIPRRALRAAGNFHRDRAPVSPEPSNHRDPSMNNHFS